MAAEICEIEFGTIGGKTLFREALSRGSSLEKVRRNARTFWLHDGPLARKRRAFAGELSGVSFLRLDRNAKLFAHAYRLDCEAPGGRWTLPNAAAALKRIHGWVLCKSRPSLASEPWSEMFDHESCPRSNRSRVVRICLFR